MSLFYLTKYTLFSRTALWYMDIQQLKKKKRQQSHLVTLSPNGFLVEFFFIIVTVSQNLSDTYCDGGFYMQSRPLLHI